MKLNSIYFSPTGATKKIVDTISDEVELGNCNTYDITLPLNREGELSFGSNDLVIIGVPVYGGRIPQFLRTFFDKIKGNNTKAIYVVLYGNRDYEDALLELKTIFDNNGFIGIAAGAFIGEHSRTKKVATNRPDTNDLSIAKDFAMKINAKLKEQDFSSNLNIKGNYPFKDIQPAPKLAPITSSACNNCGICARTCPMDAINILDVKSPDIEKCIKCGSCVKKCPVNAKEFTQEGIIQIVKRLEDSLSNIRKEPDILV